MSAFFDTLGVVMVCVFIGFGVLFLAGFAVAALLEHMEGN